MFRFTRTLQMQPRLEQLKAFSQPLMLDLDEARKVLFFAPHPDDETLGCGGTLAALARRCPVKVVLVTDGGGAGELPEGTGETRQQEFRAALGVLGIQDTVFLDQPDGAFQTSAPLESTLCALVAEYQPDWIFLPSPIDYHRDHLRITECVTRLSRGITTLKKLVFYEIWAPVPATHVVDITDDFSLKIRALEEHRTSMAYGDYVRAIEGLNRYRGLYLGRNRFAEAFLVIKVPQDEKLLRKVTDTGLAVVEAMAAGGSLASNS